VEPASGNAAALHDVGFLQSLRLLRNKMSNLSSYLQWVPYPNILPAESNSEFDRIVGKKPTEIGFQKSAVWFRHLSNERLGHKTA
jgi:hypothetical protein